jgi:Arc/MetJ family transcription regulator
MKKLVVPTFESEAEEAAWWQRHRAAVETALRAAIRERKAVSLQDALAEAKRKKGLSI